MDQLINALQQPQVPIVAGQPLPALDGQLPLGVRVAMLVRLAQPKDMRHDLRANAGLGPQTSDSHKGRQNPTYGFLPKIIPRRRVGQQVRVVAVDDVHGQVRVGPRQLVEELALEAEVHAVPEGEAVALAGLEVRGREVARRGRRREGLGHGGRQARAEGAEGVDAARDAVEGDAF